ncbi:MAG: coenzyme A pyrophosphatase, partial [Gemmatimonadota bacterium]|nr:coenzyme A pyrophosphatase [Gemmatimonadota bacterium]
PGNRGVTVIRREREEFRGPGFLVPRGSGEHLVWGFTAMVLDAMFDRLEWTEEWDASRELPLEIPSR